MKIECCVSLGELIDKLSILIIKEEKISDIEKLTYIKDEKIELENILMNLKLDETNLHLLKMVEINKILWKIEDDIREKERAKEFDEEFIKLARAVYINNDERFKRKNEINQKYNSKIVEVKSYKDY
jgi:hypothetical protein